MSKRTMLREFLSRLPDFVYDYIEIAYTGESINTQIGYSIDIKTFFEYLKRFKFRDIENTEDFTPKHMEQVTLRDLTSFMAYLQEYETESVSPTGKTVRRIRKNSAFGINRKLSGIRGLFSYLYKNDLISQNVTEKLDFKKLHQKIKKPLTSQETVRLLDVIYNGEKYYTGRDLTEYERRKQRDIALFTAYLGTGCRVSELINIDVDDICFDTSSFVVTRKGGDQQEIFMPVQVENEMFSYWQHRREMENLKDPKAFFINRQGKRMSAQGVEKVLKKYCMTVGIEHPDKTRPHALRRTFACNMIADGVDIKMVAELMGHKNIDVTHRYYAQYASKRRKEIMRGFDVTKDRDEK
ncbi:MAG: tyrosine-type recombinase/integrase [Clostridiales bacterium]|nr:tyrosine-type recombinase/integrase [Clostridiales bacterium]